MKYILSIIICLAFFHNGLSQNSYSWSEPGSIWTYKTSGQRIESGGDFPSYLKRIIMKSADSTNTSANSAFYYDQFSFAHTPMENGATFLYSYALQNNYEFALHNNVVFFKQPEFTYDTINWIPADDTIVNFNANIGDTWRFHDPFIDPFFIYSNFTSGITTVLDTGTRTINGENLKWIYVKYTVTDETLSPTQNIYNDTIFEKIGPKLNMIPSEYFYGFDSNFGGGSHFACYSDNNFTEYTALQNVCDFYLGKEWVEEDIILFYPNPTSNVIRFSELIDSKIFIYDLSGKLILEINENVPEVDLSKLNAGIYVFKTFKNGQKVSSLIIKK